MDKERLQAAVREILLAVGENERAAEALDKALAAGETNG